MLIHARQRLSGFAAKWTNWLSGVSKLTLPTASLHTKNPALGGEAKLSEQIGDCSPHEMPILPISEVQTSLALGRLSLRRVNNVAEFSWATEETSCVANVPYNICFTNSASQTHRLDAIWLRHGTNRVKPRIIFRGIPSDTTHDSVRVSNEWKKKVNSCYRILLLPWYRHMPVAWYSVAEHRHSIVYDFLKSFSKFLPRVLVRRIVLQIHAHISN